MTKKITFTLAPEIVAEATDGILLGDFNSWIHESGVKLKKQKDGSLKATLELEPGIYQYRYFLNDGRWVNDGNAQGYTFNGEYGVDNCIISIPFEEVKETVAKGELVTDVEVKPKNTVAKKVAASKVEVEVKKAPVTKEKAVSKKPAAKVEKVVVAPKAPAKKVAPAAKTVAPAAKKVAPVAKKVAPAAKAATPAKKTAKKTK